VELAATTGKLRRVFVWGSFVTAKSAPRDLDILLIMDNSFEVARIAGPAQEIFDCMRAKLLFESDVFWARASIGEEVLGLWLGTCRSARDCGTGTARRTGAGRAPSGRLGRWRRMAVAATTPVRSSVC
jgi:hypothetical protein